MDWKAEIDKMRSRKREVVSAGKHALADGARAVRDEFDHERDRLHKFEYGRDGHPRDDHRYHQGRSWGRSSISSSSSSGGGGGGDTSSSSNGRRPPETAREREARLQFEQFVHDREMNEARYQRKLERERQEHLRLLRMRDFEEDMYQKQRAIEGLEWERRSRKLEIEENMLVDRIQYEMEQRAHDRMMLERSRQQALAREARPDDIPVRELLMEAELPLPLASASSSMQPQTRSLLSRPPTTTTGDASSTASSSARHHHHHHHHYQDDPEEMMMHRGRQRARSPQPSRTRNDKFDCSPVRGRSPPHRINVNEDDTKFDRSPVRGRPPPPPVQPQPVDYDKEYNFKYYDMSPRGRSRTRRGYSASLDDNDDGDDERLPPSRPPYQGRPVVVYDDGDARESHGVSHGGSHASRDAPAQRPDPLGIYEARSRRY